ncbi:MAG: class I SAM-dependent methyltransferase [Gammaproteobacteria bacterium]|nr:class I SAM-dependent methyltransferase [Gammaproteobacteria bacterium]
MIDSKGFQYTGTDNLEVMAEAVNYNAFLAGLVDRYCAGSHRIIDFGAGIGTFAVPLHMLDRDIIAVEPDESQCQRMASLGLNCVPEIDMIPDGWADAIYSINVLEHIEDDEATLKKIYAKLKPGGRLFIYVPAFQLLYSCMDRKVGHFRRYERAGLVAKAANSGLQVTEARYVDSLGFLAALMYKWRSDNSGDLNRTALKIFDRFVFPISRLLDRLTSAWFGKNLILVATKRAD